MDKKYITLFTEIARATEVSAEQVMDIDKQNGDEKGEKTARIMRDDYAQLHDKLSAEDFDGNLTKNDFIKMMAGAMIQVNQLQDRITNLRKAMSGYQNDLIPKLQKIIEKAQTDEEAMKLAEEILTFNEN